MKLGTTLSYATAAVYCVAIPAVYLWNADGVVKTGILVALALGALSPVAGIAWLVGHADSDAVAARNTFFGLLVICGLGLRVYTEAFYFHPNPQGGMAAVFMPLIQWLGVLLMILWRLRFKTS